MQRSDKLVENLMRGFEPRRRGARLRAASRASGMSHDQVAARIGKPPYVTRDRLLTCLQCWK
jgi:hypothetical protein